jgi:hypothetical protein
VGVPVDGHRAARALLPPGARDNVVAERVMAPEDGRRFFLGDAGAFGPQEGMTVKNLGAIVRTMGVHGYPEIQGPATLVRAIGASTPKTPAMSMAPERVR